MPEDSEKVIPSCVYTGALLRIIEELYHPKDLPSGNPPALQPPLTPRMTFHVWLRPFGTVEEEEGFLQLVGTAELRAAASLQFSAPLLALPVISCTQKRYLIARVFIPNQLQVPASSLGHCEHCGFPPSIAPDFGLPTLLKCPPNT